MSQDELNKILRDIELSAPGGVIEGVALVSREGLMISSSLKYESNEDMIAAMTATLHALGEQAVREMEKGELKGAFVKGENGYALVGKVGDSALLILLARKEAQMGVLLYLVEKMAKELEKYI
ncbi:MAG: roadblock/LC7 domain-containing protein [Candidatus Asgardarchaeia archaeon]